MIAVGDKRAIAVRGDYRPVEINVGGRKVAGWTEQAVEGVTQAEFADTYNDRAQVTVQGARLEQVSTTGAQLWPYGDVTFETYATYEVMLRAGTYKLAVTANSTDEEFDKCLLAFHNGSDRVKSYSIARNTPNVITVEVDKDIMTVYFYASANYDASRGDTATFSGIMLNAGDTATNYEPYSGGYASPSPDWPQPIHGTEAVVTVSNADTEPVQTTLPVLYGRDGVCDVLETDVVVDGVHRSRVTKWWQTLVLDGTEGWTEIIGTGGRYYYIRIGDIGSVVNGAALCTHYPVGLITSANTFVGCYVVNSAMGEARLIIRPKSTMIADIATWTQYLAAQYTAGPPVTVVYQLAEPVVELGDPIDIRTLPRSTIIGCTDPFSAVVKVVERDA